MGWIYILRCSDSKLYKIGYTNRSNPADRIQDEIMAEWEEHRPSYPLSVYQLFKTRGDAEPIETDLHRLYSHFRVKGYLLNQRLGGDWLTGDSEWFRFEPQTVQQAAETIAGRCGQRPAETEPETSLADSEPLGWLLWSLVALLLGGLIIYHMHPSTSFFYRPTHSHPRTRTPTRVRPRVPAPAYTDA